MTDGKFTIETGAAPSPRGIPEDKALYILGYNAGSKLRAKYTETDLNKWIRNPPLDDFDVGVRAAYAGEHSRYNHLPPEPANDKKTT